MRRTALTVVPLLALALAGPARSAPAPSGQPLDLSTKLTMDCIAPGNAWALADCGDLLKSAFVEETMPKPGKVSVGSTVFTWPSAGLQGPDTVAATGQKLTVPAGKGWSSVALLCAFRGGDQEAGNTASMKLRYTDGTSELSRFRAYEWKAHPELSAFPGVRVQTGATVLFDEGRMSKALAPVDPRKTLASVELPSTGNPPLLVWAVSLSKEKAPAKV